MMIEILAILVAVTLAWAYQLSKPRPPLICGSPGAPPVTSPRVKLNDGRYIAYKEYGVPKEIAKYKMVLTHGFNDTKDNVFPCSQDLVEELGICFVSFDRAGYGESDPNPNRSVKSEAMDIEELADQLDLGSKFFVIGPSMGSYSIWGCLKYIPHRLKGALLLVPAISYWWQSFPKYLTKAAFNKLDKGDRMAFWIAHNLPSMLHVWIEQNIFISSPAIMGDPSILADQDFEINKNRISHQESIGFVSKSTQQGEYESIYRDLKVLFGKWEFDPMELENPFPNNEGCVHMWTGRDDRLCPADLQRYVASKLPWVKYHENPHGAHFFVYVDDWADKIIKSFLLGD